MKILDRFITVMAWAGVGFVFMLLVDVLITLAVADGQRRFTEEKDLRSVFLSAAISIDVGEEGQGILRVGDDDSCIVPDQCCGMDYHDADRYIPFFVHCGATLNACQYFICDHGYWTCGGRVIFERKP